MRGTALGAAGRAGRTARACKRWAGRRRAAGARALKDARGAAGARQGRGKRAAGRRAAQALCERPCATWACCWASRLCTQCTRPVLTHFRLSTVPESIFGENFFKKKKIFQIK